MKDTFPVVDLFAGPGGLGEGFATLGRSENTSYFKIVVSVEKDDAAHRTLLLRSFFRQFPPDRVPAEYYSYLRRDITRSELFSEYPQEAELARDEAWRGELGSGESFNKRLDAKISREVAGADRWVLIGGPPCQAYSVAGRVRNKAVTGYSPEKDLRHFLYREYLRILARHRPAVFVMENVKGILSSRINDNLIFERILNDLEDPASIFPDLPDSDKHDYKYRIFSLSAFQRGSDLFGRHEHDPGDFVVKSEKYGIPQARHRVILMGVREDLCLISPDTLRMSASEVTAKDVIDDLPRLRSGLSKLPDGGKAWIESIRKITGRELMKEIKSKAGAEVAELIIRTVRNLRVPRQDRGEEFIMHRFRPSSIELLKWYRDDCMEGVCNHSARGHIVEDLHRYLFASCFARIHGHAPRLDDFPRVLYPDHRNIDEGHFVDRFKVQIPDQPSSTITSHISKDGHYYIHYDPSQCRSLTVREAARLQTFPDNYFFEGNRTQQFVQVGNAVPPFLAMQIARIVLVFLEKTRNLK